MSFRIIESFNLVDYLLIIFLTLLSYIFYFYFNYFTRPNPFPGPLPLPFGLERLFFDGNFKRLITELYQKYGDVCEFRLGGYRRIVLSKPDYFENLLPLSKNLAVFTKHEYSPGVNMLGNFGRGMFLNNNYESWKINKYFLLQSISTPDFNEEVIKNTIESFEKLDGYWNSLKKSQSRDDDDWFQMDLLKWTSRFMTDIISIITTGERGCSMETYYNTFNDKSKLESSPFDDSKLYNSDKFTRALVAYMRGLASFYYIHPFFIRHVPYYKNKADILQENKYYVIKTLDNMIERRKFDFANTPEKLKSKSDLLTLLITSNHDAKSKMAESLSDENIRALLCDTFMAGSDSTSNAICFIIYYLCHNPHVKQKMFDEIDSVLPNNSSGTLCITTKHLEKLKYCEAIIKEASRLVPALPIAKRLTTAECEVAGYKWPAKTVFHLNYIGIHMNEKYWTNPTVFDPDRFYDLSEFNDDLNNFDKENKKSIHDKDKFSLVIFGGGIRMCPGKRLATINILTFMALMFKKYDVEVMDIEAPLKTNTAFVTNCVELKVKIKPRK